MAVGYLNASGVDFDSLFDPYVQGTSPAATGFLTSAGVDLAGRYAPIAFGTKGPDVGYRNSAGVDLSNLWAAFGTASYAIFFSFNGGSYLHSREGPATTNTSMTLRNDGTWQAFGNPGTSIATGPWLAPLGGTVGQYSVRWRNISTGGAWSAYANLATNQNIGTTSVSGTDAYQEHTYECEVRRDSTGLVVGKATYTLTAEILSF